MINDVLEQLTEDYFRHLGYFTQHNIKYKPNLSGHAYAVHSDIDIVAVHPKKKGINKVLVASCKSRHGGMRVTHDLQKIVNNDKKFIRVYREVAMPVWSKALQQKMLAMTGQKTFIFYIVCTSYDLKQKHLWETNKLLQKNLPGCEIKLLDLETMVKEVWGTITTITPAHSELSRLLQMIHHSGGKLSYN